MKLAQQLETYCATCKTNRTFNFGQLNCGAIAMECTACHTAKKLENEYEFCCLEMKNEAVNKEIIDHDPLSNEYSIIYPNGESINTIQHCPWCGSKLPEITQIIYLQPPEEEIVTVEQDKSADWVLFCVCFALAIVSLFIYLILMQ